MKSSAATKSRTEARSRVKASPGKDKSKSKKMKMETAVEHARITTPAKRPAKRSVPAKSAGSKDKPSSSLKKELVKQGGNVFLELRPTIQVALFILGIWSHHFLVTRLFGADQPSILATMIPGVEWMMMGFLLRDVVSGSARGRITVDT